MSVETSSRVAGPVVEHLARLGVSVRPRPAAHCTGKAAVRCRGAGRIVPSLARFRHEGHRGVPFAASKAKNSTRRRSLGTPHATLSVATAPSFATSGDDPRARLLGNRRARPRRHRARTAAGEQPCTPALHRRAQPLRRSLQLVQAEILRRLREKPDDTLRDAFVTTVVGIAAGMRNTG